MIINLFPLGTRGEYLYEGSLGQGDASVGVLVISHDPASAARVRHSIAADLARHDVVPDRIDDVVLVANELVTNAVLHTAAGGDDQLDVAWEVAPDHVLVRVADTSPDVPHRRSTHDTVGRGRGLSIVAALALDWGVRRTNQGKQVWARVPIAVSAVS
jgi:anti-sigma regulatory factor (Ser/Thr protein kinase)